jgi:hypothetical protein
MAGFWLAWIGWAVAGAPERLVETFEVGSGEVRQFSVDASGETVAMVAGSQAVILDIRSWEVTTLNPCPVGGATLVDGVAEELELWVGCQNGDVRLYTRTVSGWAPVQDVGQDGVVEGLSRRVHAMHHTPGGAKVYAVGLEDDVDQLRIAVLDADFVDRDAVLPLTFDRYGGSAIGTTHLYVTSEGSFIASMPLMTNLPSFNLGGAPSTFTSVAPTARASALVVNRRDDGSLVEYNAFTSNYIPVITPAPGIRAVGSIVDEDSEESFVVVGYDARVDVWEGMAGGLSGDGPLRQISITGTLRALMPVSSGYVFGGTTAGRLLILTDKPWVRSVALSEDRVSTGQDITLSFETDTAGTYTVSLGGTYASGGQVIADGEVSAGPVTLPLVVGDWAEGEQWLFVRLTDAQGRVGHAGVPISVDAPPGRVELTGASLAYDDGLLRVRFNTLPTGDIERYTVYVSTVAFTADEWLSGGPDYEGPDDLEAPVVVQPDGQPTLSVLLAPLTNHVTYYVAVRATDQNNMEGPMNNIVEGRPRPTQSAAQLAGERGGMDCSSVPRGSIALGLLGLLLARRRRSSAAVRAALGPAFIGPALGALALIGTAYAFPDEDEDGIDDRLQEHEHPKGDLTPAWANAEVRYGFMRLQDENLNQVYPGAGVLFVELGPQFYRFFELDFGAGIVRKKGFTVDDAGNPGSRETQLTVLPLAVSPVFRLHILDEQFVVPYANIGLDWWLWQERVEGIAGAKEVFSGSKFGYHWSVGLNVLLDTFSRSRASLLEAQSGINDSWLTFEYRRQRISGEQGLSFSGDVFSAGLKIDF